MNISRMEPRERAILDRLRARPRLEGLHVTDTIYCNVKAWGHARLGALGESPPFDDATLLRFLMGHGMAHVLEAGEMRQVETIAPDTEDVGTIDLWLRDHPVEIKVTSASVRRDMASQTHWLEQLGEYAWRAIAREKARPWGELWAVHLLGDWGKKFCPKHGIPETEFKRKHPDTGRPRLACPVDGCWDFLAEGSRETMLRCWRVEWTWGELDALHSTHAWRQQQLQDDIADSGYSLSNPPPIRWGYQQEFECRTCPFRQREDGGGWCPGAQETDELEAQLQGSIMALEQEKEETTA